MADPKDTKQEGAHRGKTLRGTVVSGAMKDTATVLVERYEKHPTYGKFVRRRKKYAAHDPGNTHAVGETVTIVETKPLSKTKRFRILETKES